MKGTSETSRHQGRCLLPELYLPECDNAVLCYCILITLNEVVLKCNRRIQFRFRCTGMKYRTVKAYIVFVYISISILRTQWNDDFYLGNSFVVYVISLSS
jgi:hypothetical protein